MRSGVPPAHDSPASLGLGEAGVAEIQGTPSKSALVLVAKVPAIGRRKSRLAAGLGSLGALEVAISMLKDALRIGASKVS